MISRPTCRAIRAAPWSSSTARTGRCAPACSRCRRRPTATFSTFKTGGTVVEFEERHTIFDQPGKLRLGVFANSGNTGNYREALAIEAANPALDINDGDGEHPPRPTSNTASTSTSSSRSPRISACSPARAGTTARTKSCPSRTSTAAFRAACRSRAAIGDDRTTPSASAARSTAFPPRIATSSPPAASAC